MSIANLTGSHEDARRWREDRYRFAHHLGEVLAGPRAGVLPLSGPVVYGIWLRWGLLYIGQTTDAARRLRDLPIGESHHLANSFPPEIWDRVVVISWPLLPESAQPLATLDGKTIGLALEHHLQVATDPLANGARRMAGGGWRDVHRGKSRSVGAQAAVSIGALADRVLELWRAAEESTGSSDSPHQAVRCVRPAARSGS